MSGWWGIVWLCVLLLANAFFVGAEFAVISARRSQIEPLAQSGSARARTALWAMEHATLMLAACQLGITVCSLVMLNVSEPAIHHLLEGPLAWTGLAPAVVQVTAFAITLVLVSYLHVLFGELLPKNAAFSMPDQAVLCLAPPLVWLARALRYPIAGMNWLANVALRVLNIDPKTEATSTYTLDEVAGIVIHSQNEGLLEDRSGALSAAFTFTKQQVRQVLVPTDRLVTLPHGSTPIDVEAAVTKYGFSRYPMRGDGGQLAGYVHIKDLLRLGEGRVAEPIPAKRVRELLTLPADMALGHVLARMQRHGVHLAKAVDARGTELGVVFLEDVIEQLVGEVHDATRRTRS